MIKFSSPYDDTFPPKDSDGVNDTANDKDFIDDASLDINQDSSPYNDVFPQKDGYGINNAVNNKGLREDASLGINQDSSPYIDSHSPKS